jgi:hypothetical protein
MLGSCRINFRQMCFAALEYLKHSGLRSIFVLSCCLFLGLPFGYRDLNAVSIFDLISALCMLYPIFLDLITVIMFDV